MLTRSAQGPVANIHDRMPLALTEEGWEEWLDSSLADPTDIRELRYGELDPEQLYATPVNPLVNSVRNNGPELLEPHPENGTT